MTAYNPEPKDIDINGSAAELRNYTLAFVSFLLYVLITAASTTHEQLLRISTVKLPLLDIDIPIVQFYLVSPLLILILHFHLLLQHFLFSQQFYSFDAALKLQYPDHADRARFMKSLSGNLSLVHLLGGYQKTAVQILLAAILAICLLVFPLFNLWFLQAKFLPFHDNDYTNWQVLMVVMDCGMVLALLPKTFDENDNAFRWWLSVFSPLWWLKLFYLQELRQFYHFIYQRNSLTLFNWQLLDKLVIKAKIKKLMPKYRAVLQTKIVSVKQFLLISGFFSFVAVIFLLSFFVSTLPSFEYEEKGNLFINDRERWVGTYFQEIRSLTNILHGGNSVYTEAPFLFRNLDLSEKIITADENLNHELENTLNRDTTLEKIAGIDLKNRDLRYAKFNGAILPKADLNGANIKDSHLRNVQMQGANLSSTRLLKSGLYFSKMQGSNLLHVQLQESHLYSVQLQGASLYSASLQNSKLESVQLQGADLSVAHLGNAFLSKVDLRGANLRYVNLEGTNFKNTKLQGAYFKDSTYSKSTVFPIEQKHNCDVNCLTNNKNFPICKKYNPSDTKTLKKITAYWINNLSCSDKWIAQGIINNYLFDDDGDNADKFKTYLIPLLKKKLIDKDCTGIQNLPDDFKQQIKDAIKEQK